MASEKKWLAVVAMPLTADGTSLGLVTVADTAGFKVKGSAYLVANTVTPLQVQIQRVINDTQMIVGTIGTTPAINNYIDVSKYTVALGAQIAFPEQDKNKIKPDDIEQAVYEADPTVAIRTIFVDQYGRFYNTENPLPISFDGTVSVGKVEVEGSNGNILEPNPDGSINVNLLPSTSTTDTVRNTWQQVTGVLANLPTVVTTYTVPMNKTALLTRAVASGDTIATFTLAVNGITLGVQRTHWSSGHDSTFEFATGQDNGYVLQPGDVVTVTVLHLNTRESGIFDSRIQVFEITT